MIEPLTGETITDDEIRWLRDNTGWVGEEREREHRFIGAALRGDAAARALCAEALNIRRQHDPRAGGVR